MDVRDVTRQMADELGALGVRSGDSIMVHSAFKSLGPVEGGIETVVLGLLRAIGDAGTLLMPALSYALRPPEVFHAAATPVNVGAVPEYFRTRPGTVRSVHPTHSVCAVGPRAHDLLDDHWRDSTPCGEHSPFRKLAQTGGKLVFLGCGLRANTTMHALEEMAAAPYVLGPSHRFTLVDASGVTYEKAYRIHDMSRRGYTQRYDRVAELVDSDSCLHTGQVLQAFTHVLDAPALKRSVLRQLAVNPYHFVDVRL